MTGPAKLAALCKLPVSALNALSATAAYILAAGSFEPGALWTFAGVFFSAAGACALNEWQERELDARMTRTQSRPIPSGAVSPRGALVLSSASIALGLAVLLAAFGTLPAALALGAVAWYNGFYTPLKKVTPFAVVPGSLVGVLAPAAGWTAAGAGLADIRLGALAFFFFMWQVPHFWTLGLIHAEDYERAGLPSIRGVFGEAGTRRLIFVWTAAAALSCLLLPLFGAVDSRLAAALLAAAAAWACARSASLLREGAALDPARTAISGLAGAVLLTVILF